MENNLTDTTRHLFGGEAFKYVHPSTYAGCGMFIYSEMLGTDRVEQIISVAVSTTKAFNMETFHSVEFSGHLFTQVKRRSGFY